MQPLDDDILLIVTGGKNNDNKKQKIYIIGGVALCVLLSLPGIYRVYMVMEKSKAKKRRSGERYRNYHTDRINYNIGETLDSGFCIELVENDYNDVD